MNLRKLATISLLVLSSFAANNVAPSKAELETMYDRAFREFNANHYEQALKELDAIDARQPDLAESANLRGVISMRQQKYDEAEKALQKALSVDPKFWNAKFNLAEIPFLQKNWAEARNRFQALLFGNDLQLQGEALQLIQYKILLTYLLEGKENMVDSVMAKLELSPDTPAVHYANAAMAFQHKDDKTAKDWLGKAEKNFSPQLNKLFAESIYEIGWMEKPTGQARPALELTSAAERGQKAKALARSKFEEAEQAFQQRDLTAARKAIDEADAADPNQPAYINLRGEILLAQKDFDGAENAFRQAVKVDSNFREAQYNLAQIPFKKKDWEKARERFEALYSATPAPGGDKNQASQLIKFKIYLTLLLEGKDARAQKMMEQFQFTGDTPALYYAQAAWEFKHNNQPKANDWITSARKIYSPAMNMVFADAFYDLGWLQQNVAQAPTQASSDLAKTEGTPSVEPTPIPGAALAANSGAKQPAQKASPAEKVGATGTQATTQQSPAAVVAQANTNTAAVPAASNSPSVETPVLANASPAETRAPVPVEAQQTAPASSEAPAVAMNAEKTAPPVAQASTAQPPASAPPQIAQTNISATPATVLAPATVREWSQPSWAERLGDWHAWLPIASLVAGLVILLTVVVSYLKRRAARAPAFTPAPVGTPRLAPAATPGGSVEQRLAGRAVIAGGPRQISLQLKASEPSVRRGPVPFNKSPRSFGGGLSPAGVATPAEQAPAEMPITAVAEPILEPVAETMPVAEQQSAVTEVEAAPMLAESERSAVTDWVPPVEIAPEVATSAAAASTPERWWMAPEETTVVEAAATVDTPAAEPVAEIEPAAINEQQTMEPEPQIVEPEITAPAVAELMPFETRSEEAPIEQPAPEPVVSSSFEAERPEPIGQGQPVPHLIPGGENGDSPAPEIPTATPASSRFAKFVAAGAALAGIGSLRRPSQPSAPAPEPSVAPETEPQVQAEAAQQPLAETPVLVEPTQTSTETEIMPPPTQPTPAPQIRTTPQAPMTGGAPQAQPSQSSGGLHTAVQLTFAFEIAALQLTPAFRMGALQLRPLSRVVSMRLAATQQPQPAMNLQVSFEMTGVQLAGNAIGTLRLTPSQQQRPNVTGSSAFNIAGLQVLSGSENAGLQLTPGQGQAGVQVTGRFQIATVEFSPTFEIAALVLNSTSRQVAVQLPGAAQGPETAPMFDIANVQLGGGGEIAMMQLTAPRGAGAAPHA
jgi:predicted Zn-dependent protease